MGDLGRCITVGDIGTGLPLEGYILRHLDVEPLFYGLDF